MTGMATEHAGLRRCPDRNHIEAEALLQDAADVVRHMGATGLNERLIHEHPHLASAPSFASGDSGVVAETGRDIAADLPDRLAIVRREALRPLRPHG
jgi:hypothetical protein